MGIIVLIGIVALFFYRGKIVDFSKENREGCCGCIAVILITIAVVVSLGYFSRAIEKKEEEAERARVAAAEQQRKEEAIKREEIKKDKIRKFALKEMPKVWAAYQSLESEISVQNGKIEDLANALRTFNRRPELDEDFLHIKALRNAMIQTHDALWRRMEDAYLAARKFEAMPTSKDNENLLRKALEDGIAEADAAAKRFKEMRQIK